jgi:hypothetical protein
VKLTEKEAKIARLAFDKAAQPGERRVAAVKLMESLYVRGVSVEDIARESVRIEYRERVQIKTVYRDRPAEEQATTPTKCHDEPSIKGQSVRSHAWKWILGVTGVFTILLTFAHSNSTPSPIAQLNFAPGTSMTAEERKQREAGWNQFKEADRKERELLQKQEEERRARYEAKPEQDSIIIGATPAPQ